MNVMMPEEITKEFECEINLPSCHDERKTLIFPGLAKAIIFPQEILK